MDEGMDEEQLAQIEARARLAPEEVSQHEMIALCEEIRRLRSLVEAYEDAAIERNDYR